MKAVEYMFVLMARPVKCRRVSFEPDVTYFKPRAVPLFELKEVELAVDEFEAIRLRDLEGLEQEDAAKKMNISQPTFHRLLGTARKKVADALINGKAIKIHGGKYELTNRGRKRRRRDWKECRGQ